jgi:hypothetical protein
MIRDVANDVESEISFLPTAVRAIRDAIVIAIVLEELSMGDEVRLQDQK